MISLLAAAGQRLGNVVRSQDGSRRDARDQSLRGGQVARHQVHTLETVGSNPIPATRPTSPRGEVVQFRLTAQGDRFPGTRGRGALGPE